MIAAQGQPRKLDRKTPARGDRAALLGLSKLAKIVEQFIQSGLSLRRAHFTPKVSILKLSIAENFPRLAIDRAGFIQALNSGALDDCLNFLRDSGDGAGTADLHCLLAEKLFHCGRRDDALECGRRAFAAASDENTALFCAWLFSNCTSHADAAAAYERLVAIDPGWAEGYRHASGSYDAIGETERAIAYGARASDLAPANFDYALHAGSLLLDAGRAEEAARYLARALRLRPENPRAIRTLSAAALKRPDEALALALRAAMLAPEDSDIIVHAAELLLRAGHIDQAAAMLADAAGRDPSNPILWRVLSSAELQRSCPEGALTAIERALDLAPDRVEYHLHQAHLLHILGAFAEAAEVVNRAITLDPASQPARRAQLDLLLAEGRVTDATAMSGELLCT